MNNTQAFAKLRKLCACMDREAQEWRTCGGSATDTAKRMADVLKAAAQ